MSSYTLAFFSVRSQAVGASMPNPFWAGKFSGNPARQAMLQLPLASDKGGRWAFR
jgi:hypothetical protein